MKIKNLLLALVIVVLPVSCSHDEDAANLQTPQQHVLKNLSKGDIDTSDVNAWQQMMANYESSINEVMAAECPPGMTLQAFKLDVVEGKRAITSDAENQILALAQPLRQWGAAYAQQNGFQVENEEELLFLSMFSPELPIDQEWPVMQTNGLDFQDFLECAAIAIGVDFLYAAGVEGHGIKWTKKAMVKAFGKIASRMLGPVGTAIAVGSFGYCLYERY